MNKGTFFTGQPIFCQVLSFLPKQVILRIAHEHKADYYCKRFTTYEHLVTLLYSVFNQCNSLREVSTGLLAWEQRIGHLGMKHHPRRSTISDANTRRKAEVFESIYMELLQRYGHFLSDSRSGEHPKHLYIFDATTITLFKETLQGVGLPDLNGRRKGGIKVHTLLRSDQDVPCMIRYSAATANDTRFLREVHLPKGSVIVFDRGYPNFSSYLRFSNEGVTWVTRLRSAMVYEVVKENPLDEHHKAEGVLSDTRIVLGHNNKKTALKVPARLVRFIDPKTGKLFEFITNNMRLSPLSVANYYKKRWQIELLFKRIKQNFPLKYFLGDSENAIKIQIWAVLIADLLLKIIKKGTKCRMSFSNLACMVRLHLMTYMHLKTFLLSPEKELLKRCRLIIPQTYTPSLFSP
ncbi:IS4 family transposase [Flavisolibacter ginsengisoli]|jgi:hypothetical protein|uniref:Transposase DDE domain-containing protein n=1 Tax=Flavisolibacter ginsengisoli DSM 18119 TaxID=1121884 RepID=A0A1M4Y4K2_9BACT|nr:IS4 family transposase [Flavisolibacter ginsengisoli]SHF00737.1 Transposase DDE domain-containing protein [Flavisolibacter ginsengisoli DSM 18119]